MKRIICAMALVLTAAACGGGSSEDIGPTEEEMRGAVSRMLRMPEEKITDFKKGGCKEKDEGFVCEFEMYIAFNETPSKQDLDKGYFFKSDEEWLMELAV